ncbi:MAG: 2-oxoacid:acceptor oxidoreductase family protein [Bacillota bacterium]
MHYYDVVLSGFGGQGILLTGDVLAHAAMLEAKHVTWMPSYGVEMRGGAASCTVVVSSERIGSPFAEEPCCLFSMSKPSLFKYQGRVKKGGLLIVNTSFVDPSLITREDVKSICIPASEIAYQEVGEHKMANMVMLGTLISASGVVSLEKTEAAMEEIFSGNKKKALPQMLQAVRCGHAWHLRV